MELTVIISMQLCPIKILLRLQQNLSTDTLLDGFNVLLQTYFPAFEACVREGFGASIMCSYNAVNGVPSCANDMIQNKIVRKQWGFQGFFVRT